MGWGSTPLLSAKQNVYNMTRQSPFYFADNDRQFQIRAQLVDEKIKDEKFDITQSTLMIPQLDAVEFQRQPGSDLNAVTADTLTKVRNRYGKSRLFYSGGADSQFLLMAHIKNKLPLDEVRSYDKISFPDPLSRAMDETVCTGWRYLDQLVEDGSLDSARVFKTSLTEQQYTDFFSQPEFWKYGSSSPASISLTANMIVTSKLQHQTDICNLTGTTTPFVYYQDGWNFRLADRQFETEFSGLNRQHTDVVNITLEYPEFTQSYVNCIIDGMEQFPDYKERFSWERMKTKPTCLLRRFVPEVAAANGMLWGPRNPKIIDIDITKPMYHRALQRHGRCLVWSWFLEQYPTDWYLKWKYNTDWEWVKISYQLLGVWSKPYKVK